MTVWTSVLIVFILSLGSVFALETLSGQVTNTAGDLISNATVTFSLLNGTVLNQTTTANGLYSVIFDLPSTNVVNLTIQKLPAYITDEIVLLIINDETRTVNRVLGPVMTNTISGTITNQCDSTTINGAIITAAGTETFTTTSGYGEQAPGAYSRYVLNDRFTRKGLSSLYSTW